MIRRTRPPFIAARLAVLALVFAAITAACGAPPGEPPVYAAREVVATARWTVHAKDAVGGAPIGQVVKYEIRDPSGPVVFYRVLDAAGRWLGHADAQLRFSRRVPFEAEERDLGLWSLERGCAELLDADTPVSLRPVAVEADFSRDG